MENSEEMSVPGNVVEELDRRQGRGGIDAASNSGMLGSGALSVALIGPDESRRRPIAAALSGLQGSATREFATYPQLDDVPRLLKVEYEVIILELDSNPEHALDLVEKFCGDSTATVMVYSSQVSPEMLVRCMRAGAREFLSQPFTPTSIAEALIRASVRRPVAQLQKRAVGKLIVFVGAKGGAGVTTVASNFAISLSKESTRSTVLIDLNFPMGDAALELGLSSQYSTVNALENFEQLDTNFVSTLLVKHSSGLSVLAAPDRYTEIQPSAAAIDKLLNVARNDFEYVVVDAGSKFTPNLKAMFDESEIIYLVVQVGITDLRNANRLISNLFRSNEKKLQIVLNRYTSNFIGLDDAKIANVLTVPVNWKIPNDYATATQAQTAASPLILEDSPISRILKQMSRVACGLHRVPEVKKRFKLFG